MTNLTHLRECPTFRRGSLMTGNPSTGRIFQIALFACLTLLALSTRAIAQAGHLDTSFGNGQPGIFGFSQSSVNGSSTVATAVALQTDGKIVIAGQAGNRSALLRLTTNGNLDSIRRQDSGRVRRNQLRLAGPIQPKRQPRQNFRDLRAGRYHHTAQCNCRAEQ